MDSSTVGSPEARDRWYAIDTAKAQKIENKTYKKDKCLIDFFARALSKQVNYLFLILGVNALDLFIWPAYIILDLFRVLARP